MIHRFTVPPREVCKGRTHRRDRQFWSLQSALAGLNSGAASVCMFMLKLARTMSAHACVLPDSLEYRPHQKMLNNHVWNVIFRVT